MRRRTGRLGPWLAAVALGGCATLRVVPMPAPGVAIGPEAASVTTSAFGVTLVVRPSAWDGSPGYLDAYVTPFHLDVANGATVPVGFGYADLRVFDDARYQYTALPPVEVERILRAATWLEPSPAGSGVVLASVQLAAADPGRGVVRGPAVASDGAGAGMVPRRVSDHGWRPYWGAPWWWGPPWWGPGWGWPGPYPPIPLDDILTRALPVGVVQPGARIQGFVYFPRLRPGVRRLTLELHARVGEMPAVLAVPFAVEGRGARVTVWPAQVPVLRPGPPAAIGL